MERLRFDSRGEGRTYVAETADAGDYPLGPGVRGSTGLTNVHGGTSIHDQPSADANVPIILQTRLAVRFVSYEPALGPVDFTNLTVARRGGPEQWNCLDREEAADAEPPAPRTTLDWIIVGGESGPGARPCDVAWIRSVVAQGKAANVPVFVKQLGARPWYNGIVRPGEAFPLPATFDHDVPLNGDTDYYGHVLVPRDRKGGDPAEWPDDLRVRELPGGAG